MNNLERFDSRSGIAKVKYKDKDIYVTYGFFCDKPWDERELGEAIGKGNTEIEALKMAIKTLINRTVFAEHKLQELSETIDKIQKQIDKNADKKPIVPLKYLEHFIDEKGEGQYRESKDFINADVGICVNDNNVDEVCLCVR